MGEKRLLELVKVESTLKDVGVVKPVLQLLSSEVDLLDDHASQELFFRYIPDPRKVKSCVGSVWSSVQISELLSQSFLDL